jgi:putative transposase
MQATNNAVTFFHLAGELLPKGNRLQSAHHYRALLTRVRRGLEAFPMEVIAYCLVPDSWHLVVERTGSACPMALCGRVTATQTDARASPSMDPKGALFRAEPLVDAATLIDRCVEIERLAVSIGLAGRAEDWPWGSAADRFRCLDGLPLADGGFLTSASWLSHLNEPRPGDRPRLGLIDDDVAEYPRGFAGGPKTSEDTVKINRRAHQHEAHAHVERPEHLRVRHATGRLQPGEQRRHLPARAVEAERGPGW